MKRLLITGGSGYLGRRLVIKARGNWEVLYTFFTHAVENPGARGVSIDIRCWDQVIGLFRDYQPDAVIHTAYNEKNLDVIIQGTEHIARASAMTGARLLHLSTDAVFSGERGWYRESDIPAPVHPYGKAKLESERLVSNLGLPHNCVGPVRDISKARGDTFAGSNSAIIRTSLIWGLDPIDVKTQHLRDSLQNDERVVLFTDEYRCPIYVEELAAALLELISLDFCGIIHIAGPQRLSRYEFGIRLAAKLGLDCSRIMPGLNSESGLVRPRDCSLDTSLAQQLLRTRISPASDLLA